MNLLQGIFYHWLGGLASASFYIPYRGVRRWSWETYWLVGGFFSWIIAPLFFASLLVPDFFSAIRQTTPDRLMWTYLFGMMWGIGGLTFGLTMRYLGIALGMAVALGLCMVFGTLIPPIYNGTIGEVAGSLGGKVVLLGVAVCFVGIAISGLAGMSKERELSPDQKLAAVKEFNFARGMTVAVISGILSACFAFGFEAGQPIADHTRAILIANDRSVIWEGLPRLVVILWGGFTTNFIWCVILNLRNRSSHEYLALRRSNVAEISAAEGVMMSPAAEQGGTSLPTAAGRVPLLRNYLFSALAGVTWYLQFFFYSMGETKMGEYRFSSWTMHMASIIIFSTLWGIALHEWRGVSRRTWTFVLFGLLALVACTLVIGYGNWLAASPAGH